MTVLNITLILIIIIIIIAAPAVLSLMTAAALVIYLETWETKTEEHSADLPQGCQSTYSSEPL